MMVRKLQSHKMNILWLCSVSWMTLNCSPSYHYLTITIVTRLWVLLWLPVLFRIRSRSLVEQDGAFSLPAPFRDAHSLRSTRARSHHGMKDSRLSRSKRDRMRMRYSSSSKRNLIGLLSYFSFSIISVWFLLFPTVLMPMAKSPLRLRWTTACRPMWNTRWWASRTIQEKRFRASQWFPRRSSMSARSCCGTTGRDPRRSWRTMHGSAMDPRSTQRKAERAERCGSPSNTHGNLPRCLLPPLHPQTPNVGRASWLCFCFSKKKKYMKIIQIYENRIITHNPSNIYTAVILWIN